MFRLKETIYLKNNNKNIQDFAFVYKYDDAIFNYMSDLF